MDRRVGSGGFTIGEALVVVLALVFAAAILLPALARVRSIPNRPTCGVRLAGIGKAMQVYANDYEGLFPRAGARDASWAARTPNWLGKDRREAFGIGPEGVDGQASVSASLYLLVKYTALVPAQFLCPGRDGCPEKGTREFTLDEYGIHDRQLADLWDFGPNPPLHCSYAYQMIYGPHKLAFSTKPGIPIAADRNPWMDSPSAKAKDFSRFNPDLPPFNGTVEQALLGNAVSHQEQGQNVLFQDTHVSFQKRATCGLEGDNIYTFWEGTDKLRGRPPDLGSQPAGQNDSLVVNDPFVLPKR